MLEGFELLDECVALDELDGALAPPWQALTIRSLRIVPCSEFEDALTSTPVAVGVV